MGSIKPDAHHPTSEDLFAYRDGELPNEKRSLVEAHVLVCAHCKERIDEMSALESDLRMRPDDVGEDYYERLTEAVLARAAAPVDEVAGARVDEGTAPDDEVEEAAATAAAGRSRGRRGMEPPPYERRRPDVVSDDIDVRRRFRLPWIGITGSAAAALAVMIVAVILFQRQGEWIRAPRPASVGNHEAPVRPESKARSRKNAAGDAAKGKVATGAAAGEKVAGSARAPGAAKTEAMPEAAATNQAKRVPPADAPVSEGKLAREEATARDEAGRLDKDAAGAAGVAGDKKMETLQKSSATQEMAEANDSSAAAGVRRQVAPMMSANEPQKSDQTRALAPPTAASPPAGRSEAYAAVLREYSLPAVWNSGVSREALLKAEPELRRVYQTHQAGADSARIRLYLAEAERTKMGNPPDAAHMDAAVNHYRRAISLALAHGDAAVADVARKRLAQLFGVTQPSNPAPSSR